MSKDKESICVTVRVRPLSHKQLEEDSRICLRVDEYANMISMNGPNSERQAKDFYFDSVCDANTQQEMFEKVGKRSTLYCMEGYNCTIFAYGQTGAGKTYTMMGTNPQNRDYFQQRGLVPRTLQHLFQCIEKQISEIGVDYIIKCSFVEIYNEQIIDLLGSPSSSLNIRQDLKKGVYIEGVTEETISHSEEAMQILRKGSKGRHVGSTYYNETSSRSHSVFTMQIESQQLCNGIKSTKSRHFHFIDLAGSERTKKSMGDRLKQGCSINKSLHVLSMVISSLAEVSQGKARHVNYRDSKLTFLLKDSLGGNSKTHLIANVSPSFISSLETKSTLMFARKVKLIKVNKVSINEDASGNLQSLKSQIRRLRSQNLLLRNGNINIPQTLSLGSEQVNTSRSTNNQKMVTVLQQYVDQELEKQTQLQLEITKLNNKNVHLQKGIKHFSQNQKQLRMVISIYEDKIKKFKRAESLLLEQVNELTESNKIQEIKDYFNAQRQGLLDEVEKYKKLSESSALVKNLLRELKAIKEGQQNTKQEDSLINILAKNNEFLNQIKISIKQLEPDVQEGKASKALVIQNEELKSKNQLLVQTVEKHELQLAEVKDKMEQSETLLGQAISTQISLQKKIDEEKKRYTQQIQMSKSQLNDMRLSYEKMQNQVKTHICQFNQLQLINSQYQLQISQLKSELLKIKDKKLSQQSNLQEKIENLTMDNSKLEESMRKKVEQLIRLKNQSIEIKSQAQKNKQEMKSILAETSARIQQLQESLKASEIQKLEVRQKLQKESELLYSKFSQISKQNNDWMGKYEQACMEIINFQQQISKQAIQISTLRQKLEQSERSRQEQKSKWDQIHNQLVRMINEKKAQDSQAEAKLTQTQLQVISLNQQLTQVTIQYKKSVDAMKILQSSSRSKTAQLEQQINQKVMVLQQMKSENQQYKRKIQTLTEGQHAIRRQNKLLEQQINFKQLELSKTIEELEKTKKKQKEGRIAVNQQKNQMYAVKKNYQVELQCLRDQLKAKQDDFNAVNRENVMLKQASERSISQLQKKMESQFQIFKQNEGSIKKAMEIHLMNKQKKINQLKSSYDSLEIEFQDKSNNLNLLNQNIKKVQWQLEQERNLRIQIEEHKNDLDKELLKCQQNLSMLQGEHIKAAEEMENNFNQQIDFKNAEIQKLRKQCECLQRKSVKAGELEQEVNRLKCELNNQQRQCEQLLSLRQSLQSNLRTLQIRYQQSHRIVDELQQKIKNQHQEHHRSLQQQKAQQNILNEQLKQKQNLILKLDSALQNHQIQIERLHRANGKLIEEKQTNLSHLVAEINNKNIQSQTILADVQNLQQENKGLKGQLTNLEAEFVRSIDNCKSLQCQVKNLTELHRNVVTENQKLNQNSISLNQQFRKSIIESNETKALLQQQIQNRKRERNQMEKEIKSLAEINTYMQQDLNELNIVVQRKQKQIENLSYHLLGVQKKAELEEGQHNQQLKNIYESSSKEIENLNHLYEEAKLKLQNLKKENDVIHENQKSMKKNYEIQIQQLENQIKYQNEALNKNQTEILAGKDKLERLGQYAEQKDQRLNQLQQQRDKLVEELQQVKRESERKLKENEKKCLLGASQVNSLREEIKFIQDEAKNWKNRMEELQNQSRSSNQIAEKFRSQYMREKQSNKQFKLLLDNAYCQIQSFKNEVLDKDKLYHQLLQKVSKNDMQRKGLLNQDKKFSDLLQKSRIQVSQLRKKYDDQLKINHLIKQELEKKDVDVSLVKERSEEYCRRQQQLMESIRSDYTKIESQLKTTQQLLVDSKKALKKVTLKNQQLQQRVQRANKECLDAQNYTDQLKKQSLRTGIDEKQTNYVNKLKQQNTQLKRELEKTSEQLISSNQQKLRLKSQMRQGRDTDISSLELNKKISEVKYLQKIIDDCVKVLGIKNYNKSVGQSLKCGIIDLQRQATKTKSDLAQINQQMTLKNQKLQILENQKLRGVSQEEDDTLTKMRNKINRTTSNFEAIRQSKQEDKLILQSKDQNKLNLWGMGKP